MYLPGTHGILRDTPLTALLFAPHGIAVVVLPDAGSVRPRCHLHTDAGIHQPHRLEQWLIGVEQMGQLMVSDADHAVAGRYRQGRLRQGLRRFGVLYLRPQLLDALAAVLNVGDFPQQSGAAPLLPGRPRDLHR